METWADQLNTVTEDLAGFPARLKMTVTEALKGAGAAPSPVELLVVLRKIRAVLVDGQLLSGRLRALLAAIPSGVPPDLKERAQQVWQPVDQEIASAIAALDAREALINLAMLLKTERNDYVH